MADGSVEEVEEGLAVASSSGDEGETTLETLVLMLTTDKVRAMEDKTRAQLRELRERQAKVKVLHQLIKLINAKTDSKGKFDVGDDTQIAEMLQQAQELGVELDPGKTSYNREERTLLVDNIRMTIEDLNVENEMQLQTITRLTNERYEAYQLARSILKPLHDAKVNMARSLSSR